MPHARAGGPLLWFNVLRPERLRLGIFFGVVGLKHQVRTRSFRECRCVTCYVVVQLSLSTLCDFGSFWCYPKKGSGI